MQGHKTCLYLYRLAQPEIPLTLHENKQQLTYPNNNRKAKKKYKINKIKETPTEYIKHTRDMSQTGVLCSSTPYSKLVRHVMPGQARPGQAVIHSPGEALMPLRCGMHCSDSGHRSCTARWPRTGRSCSLSNAR